MSSRRRIVRRLAFVVVLLVGTAYLAFSTLLFNPLESDYEYDIASLIPRDVDFYVSKADLAQDFDPLPRPAFADAFLESTGGQAVMALPAYRDQMQALGIEESLAELETMLEGLPVAVDLLSVFGGRDLAVAGYFAGRELGDAQWAAYGRSNWIGKLGVELLGFPGLLDLESQDLEVQPIEVDGGTVGYTLSGGTLRKPLHLTRVDDVVVVGSSTDLIAAAGRLDEARGEDSLGQSADYYDHISAAAEPGQSDLEVLIDYRTLAENMQWSGRWPDPTAEGFVQPFLARFFQSAAIRSLIGTLRFKSGVTLRANGLLTSETMTPIQKRLYRLKGFDRQRILQVAQFAPKDVGLFVHGRGNVGDVLREAIPEAEQAMIGNWEDVARSVWGYADLYPLIDELDAALENEFVFVMRNYDYPPETGENAPVENGEPVPIWALMLFIDDREKVEELQTQVINRQAEFQIGGNAPGKKGVYRNEVQGGNEVYEYHSQFIDGTGHASTVDASFAGTQRVYIISNHNKMVGQMLTTQVNPSEQLAEDPAFKTLVGAGLHSASHVIWANPRAMDETLRKLLQRRAEDAVFIDWTYERPRIEKKVLAESFGGRLDTELDPNEEQQYELILQQELDAFQAEFTSQHVGAHAREYLQKLDAIQAVSGALLELSIDQKKLDVYARLIVPFD